MTTNNNEHIGIKFFPPSLYAPLEGDEPVLINTLLPHDIVDPMFEYSVNNVPGPHSHILFAMPSSSGSLRILREFAQNHPGPWPALLELRYIRDGRPVDLGVLQLRDPRKAVATQMRVSYWPTIEIPSQGSSTFNHVFAEFFDKDHVILPFRPIHWDVTLIDPPAGVSNRFNHIDVMSFAQPGEVTFKVSSQTYGLEETFTFQLIAANS